MADQKISALTSASTPLAGTEVLPIVQSSTTKKVSVANLTAGRTVATGNLNVTGDQTITGAVRALLKLYGNYAGGTDVGKIQFYNAASEFLAQININSTTGAAGDTSNMELWVESAGAAKKVITLQSTQDVDIAAGNLVPKTAAKGINFTANTPAAGMTSQLLNWYEEGTWTPSFTFASGSVTYTTRTGTYTRVGRLVTLSIYIKLATVSTPTSYVIIQNPPFVMGSTNRGAASVWTNGLVTGVNNVMCQIRNANNDLWLVAFANGATGSLTGYLQANSEFQITATYEI